MSEACAAAKGNIRVMCRVRPLPVLACDEAAADDDADASSISFPLDPSAVVLGLGGGGDRVFHFDAVLKDNCTQAQCYDEARAAGNCPPSAALPSILATVPCSAVLRRVTVESVVEGFNVCIMAYGQVRASA